MNNLQLQIEANELLRAGFDEIPASWRNRSTITSVSKFEVVGQSKEPLAFNQLPPRDGPQSDRIKTFAKMIGISQAEIDSGEYRQKIKTFGRQAAEKFNQVFDEAVNADQRAEVTFLNGQQYPTAEVREEKNEDGSYLLRGYFDYGITPVTAAAAAS